MDIKLGDVTIQLLDRLCEIEEPCFDAVIFIFFSIMSMLQEITFKNVDATRL